MPKEGWGGTDIYIRFIMYWTHGGEWVNLCFLRISTETRIPGQADYFGGKENTVSRAGKWDQKAEQWVCVVSNQARKYHRQGELGPRTEALSQYRAHNFQVSWEIRDLGIYTSSLSHCLRLLLEERALIPCPCHEESQRQPTTKTEEKEVLAVWSWTGVPKRVWTRRYRQVTEQLPYRVYEIVP